MTGSSDRAEYALSLAEQRLSAELPEIIRMQPGETLTVGHPWNTVSIQVHRHKAPAVVLAQRWMAISPAARRPVIALAVSNALQDIARQRTWKIVGTDGPPVSLLRTNALWDTLVATGRFNAQDLVDRVHRLIRDPDTDIANPEAQVGWWRNTRTLPTPINRSPGLDARYLLGRHGSEPWMAGRLLGDRVSITAYSLDDTFAIRVTKPARMGGLMPSYEIRTTRRLPETLAVGTRGLPVASVIDEDVARHLGGTIIAVTQTARTLCFRVRIEDSPAAFALPHHLGEFEWQQEQLEYRRNLVTDAIERAFSR